MITKTFDKDYLLSIIRSKSVVQNEITGNDRWSISRCMVWREPDDTLWAIDYSVGATEQQDQYPFDYDSCEATRVEAREVTTIEYWPIQ